jgi:hypothetical protein
MTPTFTLEVGHGRRPSAIVAPDATDSATQRATDSVAFERGVPSGNGGFRHFQLSAEFADVSGRPPGRAKRVDASSADASF